MSITTYTTTNSVRAVLGVSEPEIPDTVLVDPVYEVMLKEDLRAMSTTITAAYITVKADPTPTADETRFIGLFETYSAYQVAAQLLGSLAMFAPQQIEDASSKFQRNDPYAAVRTAIAESLAYLRNVLLEAYAILVPAEPAPATVTRTLVVNVGLGLNPITG